MQTNAKVWREKASDMREKGVRVTLPSGMVAYVRNLPLASVMVAYGSIPDTLTPLVTEMIGGGVTDKSIEQYGLVKVMEASMLFNDAITKLALVSPRIVEHPVEDDEISIEDIDDEDKEWLLGVLRLPASKLARFCQEQTRLMELLDAEQGDEPTAVTSDGDSPVERRPDGNTSA